MTSRSLSLLGAGACACAGAVLLLASVVGCREKGAIGLPEQPAVAAKQGLSSKQAAEALPASGRLAASKGNDTTGSGDPGERVGDNAAVGAGTASETSIEVAGGSATEQFSATTEPHRRSTLTPRVGSAIVRVFVREGQTVAAGQPVVALDSSDFELRQAQAEAALDGAKVQLDATQVEWDRVNSLAASNAIPKSQFDAVDAKLRGAKVALRAAQIGVDMTRKAVGDAVVRAPYAGIVVKRHVNEGEYATSMPPSPLITIEELGILDVRVQIPASEIGRIREGDPLVLRFPAVGKELTVKVARIVPALNPMSRTFSAIVEIENPDPEINTGMFAEARRTGTLPSSQTENEQP
ncbi:MAG: efflux RND transporter periplasmic adaptor subunit [Pseudomonadota bacterium]